MKRKAHTRGPLLGMNVQIDEFEMSPLSRTPFRVSVMIFALSVLEIAKALHRMAAEMERRSS